MSRYTTQIRLLRLNDFKFNLDKYPIFDEDYRDHLNNMILDYYLMNEIEYETAALFNHYLGVTMNLIMPKYNVLYVEQKKVLDMISADIIETFTSTNKEDKDTETNSLSKFNSTSNMENNSDTNTNSENRFSNTPMNDFGNLDNYLTSASRDDSKVKDKSTNVSDSKNDSNLDTKSKDKKTGENEYTKIIKDPDRALRMLDNIKNSFINIDYEIILELDKLFIKVM